MPLERLSDDEAILKLAMEKYKMEVAEKLGLKEKVEEQGWESMSTAECGRIGGKMSTRLSENLLKRMVESVRNELEYGSSDDNKILRHSKKKR